MRVYHFTDKKFGLRNIRRRRLKIARINDLNDPFEMLAVACANQDDRRIWRIVKDEAHKQLGLICFCRDWHNPVHWSHYADKHQGICLGFDVDDQLLIEVTYQAKRPTFDLSQVSEGTADPQCLNTVLNTKFSHWRYENEIRIAVTFNHSAVIKGLYFMDFSEKMRLREVIVGAECPVSRLELSRALGRLGDGIKCIKARQSLKSFRVVEQRKAILWP